VAVLNAHYDVALTLLDHAANANAPQPQGSILHQIAWLRRPGWNAQVDFTPPSPASEAITLEVARSLLAHGANPNAQVSWKEIKYDRNNGVVKGPPNIPVGRAFMTYVGATPFYLAARAGDFALMRVLADGGADPKIRTAQGVTPLMAAAGIGYWDAESPGPTSGAPEADRLAAVKLAVELGSDVNATADYPCPPLTGDPQWMLLNYPLNIGELPPGGDPRWNGSTALHGAAMSKQPSIIRYLVEQGARLDVKNRVGWTPLMVATEVFVSNTRKEWPPSLAVIKELMAAHGLHEQ
jgi:cytohesin